MKQENKKKLLIIVACILSVAGVLCGIFYPDSEMNNTIKDVQNIVIEEIEEIDANIVVEDITENEEESSTENTIEDEELTIEDEHLLEEEEVEDEAFELQGEIAYNGTDENWGIVPGEYKGLTYYSQIDSRWKNRSYTSIGKASQTIGSSGCGPTSAAMVVSSIKGTVTPEIMADTFVKYGYRSANNGTYWSAYRAVADEFNIGYTETADIQKAIELLRNDNYIICSVGNGLFTTGGHYIVVVGIEGETLKIYDPYLYNGKFETSTRRGKVEVSGNTIYCSVNNFKNFSNYKQFFCFQNESQNKYRAGQRVLVDVPIQIAFIQGNKAIVDDTKNQFWINTSVIQNENKIYALADIAYDGGLTDIVQVFDEQFWCEEKNMKDIPKEEKNVFQIQNTVGQKRKLRHASIIYQKSNLSGSKFNYKANTTIKILENVSSTIDKIQVVQTGRIGYIKNNVYK